MQARHELKLACAVLWFALPLTLWLLPSILRAIYTFFAETIHYWEMSGPELTIEYAFDHACRIVRLALPPLTWWFYPFAAMAMATPAVLLGLRRHRKDISKTQLARCAFYALAAGFVAWPLGHWGAGLTSAFAEFLDTQRPDIASYAGVMREWDLDRVLVPLLLGLWLLCWNWYVLKDAMRLRRAFFYWALLSLAAGIVGMTVFLWQADRWNDAVYRVFGV
ncbi:MAG: hypothetical protein KF691_13365 [Phycisphaeraceae bacterium]|nr:hypothetical protein [Phycisphaeraceae bacterium]